MLSIKFAKFKTICIIIAIKTPRIFYEMKDLEQIGKLPSAALTIQREPYPENISEHIKSLQCYEPGSAALCLHDWLLLYTIGLCIVNVHHAETIRAF